MGKRRPDTVLMDGLNKVGTSAVTAPGEVNGGCRGEFPRDHIAQLTDGMCRLMKLQPFRHFMIGFLADGHHFLFLQCIKERNHYRFEHSTTYEGRIGWQVPFLAW